VTYKVKCFSMNTTKIFTAGYVEDQCIIKTWNIKSLQCERVKINLNKILYSTLVSNFTLTYKCIFF
jgi:hypothetical protein